MLRRTPENCTWERNEAIVKLVHAGTVKDILDSRSNILGFI